MAESSQLIERLYTLSKTNKKLVKASDYNAPADKNIVVTSWKMDEFKYYNVPSPFPTLARGLFTTTNGNETEGSDVRYRVVARGYDKFFNIGEVPWTNWRAIERHTTPPYTLTLKSNGCIIFIAALSPDKILVTSKHSIGNVAGAIESHAQVGERWLGNHLRSVGKTKEQLAATLWEKNWTAVAELCDDSFEEHVLATAKEMTGLHLHGLNVNVGQFNTQPQPVVDAFAEEWGFIKTASIVLNTEREVREFSQEIGKIGKWNGEAVEGFVVRTTIGPRPTNEQSDTPPYPPGSSFFFKIKFDEPYMMYRDWRELTKSLLTAYSKGNMKDARISKAKLKRKETVVYKQWVEKEIKTNPRAFDSYSKNIGIIAVRDRFLEWLTTPEGRMAGLSIAEEVSQTASVSHKGEKVVLVPIAVPGCGKTTISVALVHLFGFGHTQSDNIKGKKPAPVFQSNIADLLKTHDVVIADRNNHQIRHREGIKEAIASMQPTPRLIALNWSINAEAPATVHRIVTERINSRGDNHQSLVPHPDADHEHVVWRFLKEAEPLAEDEVDDVIEMEVAEELEESLARAVAGVVDLLGLKRPSDEQMGEALRIAREYEPAFRARAKQQPAEGSKKEKKKASPRYYAILPELDLDNVIGAVMNSNTPVPDTARTFWNKLKVTSRYATRPHITIVHSKERENEGKLWDSCERLTAGKSPLFEFSLTHLVWNEDVMALAVGDLRLVAETGGSDEGEQFLESLNDQFRDRLHITVGTREPSVPPVQAKELTQKWRAGAGVDAIPLEGVVAKGVIKGLVS
ncbi:hypothetical protein M408DRAFT_329795 [Serendipita vermifera MAFF 305830]|uniref:tRNA ligase n=1 Tax=Serendipita vermifera MAFF 305830 TaxID=933852 RepID=A0A0C3B6U3_SERVB|nr:hypothetical protein M408DRAFT_329795 [Serendipita vermifera MAFF 305830]